ncbi:MAG: HlyD family efflux transporter periplasmic adaptor subunit [Gammaproteobacteria bacterium]|jgi:RND family efflux transporter MFP subunit
MDRLVGDEVEAPAADPGAPIAPERGRRLKLARYGLPIVILVAAVAGLVTLRMTRPMPPPAQTQERAWNVEVETVRPETLIPTLLLYGRLESPRLTELSASITADVDAVSVLAGSKVEKADVLVRLDDRESALALSEQDAELAEIEAQLESERARHENDLQALKHEEELVSLSRRQVERTLQLGRTNVASRSQIDEARAALARQVMALESRATAIREYPSRMAALEARRAKARARRERGALDLTRTRVRAPFTGRVTEVHVSPGDRVQPGTPLLSLYDPSTLEIRAQIPSSHLHLIRENLDRGAKLTAHAQLDKREVMARLERLGGQVATGSGGVDGFFRITQGGTWIELGRTLELVLALPPESAAIALPFEAVYGNNRIFRLHDGRMAGVEVERLGEVRSATGGVRLLVRSPRLRAGDRIIVTQLPNATDGLKVRVQGQE